MTTVDSSAVAAWSARSSWSQPRIAFSAKKIARQTGLKPTKFCSTLGKATCSRWSLNQVTSSQQSQTFTFIPTGTTRRKTMMRTSPLQFCREPSFSTNSSSRYVFGLQRSLSTTLSAWKASSLDGASMKTNYYRLQGPNGREFLSSQVKCVWDHTHHSELWLPAGLFAPVKHCQAEWVNQGHAMATQVTWPQVCELILKSKHFRWRLHRQKRWQVVPPRDHISSYCRPWNAHLQSRKLFSLHRHRKVHKLDSKLYDAIWMNSVHTFLVNLMSSRRKIFKKNCP